MGSKTEWEWISGPKDPQKSSEGGRRKKEDRGDSSHCDLGFEEARCNSDPRKFAKHKIK